MLNKNIKRALIAGIICFADYLMSLEKLKMMIHLLCVFLICVVYCEETKSDGFIRNGGIGWHARVSNRQYNGYNNFMNLGGYNTGYYSGQIPQNQ